ncbi:MAG: hypothetical protein IT384_28855 [Deltaproteobacteria bacterium]|nr:hypothetical protein [Deltaproteobacteria bacterium]
MTFGRRLAYIVSLLGLAWAGCRDVSPIQPRTDAGDDTQPLTCSRREDCGGRGICVGGICESVAPCQSDDQCAASGKVCHSSRGYCVQCDGRHSGECAAGQTCQFDFTCVAIGGTDAGVSDGGSCSGTCADRTMCSPDQVCRGNACCPPPARCTSPNDCPANRPECNGATGECFGGDSCTRNEDCASKPGCAGGACICDAPSAGQPGECRARPDECTTDQDCFSGGNYVGKYCTVQASPRLCADAPNCTSDASCTNLGLVCDLTNGSPSFQRCINGTPCPTGNECNPSTQVCVGGYCVAQSCITNPALCNAQQRCDSTTGMCVTNTTMSCTDDSGCSAGYWCNTAQNQCEVGCRDSTDCPGGVCDANHRCQQGMGQVCSTCTTDGDCPAGTSCKEHTLTGQKLCYESCTPGGTCTLNPNAPCLILRCACSGI